MFHQLRRHPKLGVLLLLAAVASLVFVIAANSNSLPGSKFEIDNPGSTTTGANLVVDVAGNLDWSNVADLRQGDLPTGGGDDSYVGGVKEDTPCPGVGDGSIPNNKSDLKFFGGFHETSNSGPGWLHVYWARVQDPSGTTNMDFEFNKLTADCDGAGSSKNVTRSVGDILLQFDVDRGGANATLSRRTWTGTAWSDPAVPLSATQAIGSINQQTILAANADGLGELSPRTFGEASFDLSQSFDPTACTSFGSAMLKSRSSDSFTSQLKDFIAPINVNIQNCATVIIRKQTSPQGATKLFDYTKAFSTSPASDNTFQLADDGVKTFNGVLFGSGYTVTEALPTEGWEFVSLDCSASVGVTPVVSGRTATFAVDNASDVVDCTYNNRLQEGAIRINKASVKPNTPLAGAVFSVTGPNSYSNSVTTAGADGTVCIDHLPWGTYVVTETAAPTGYAIDDATPHNVVVNNNATCAETPYGGETFNALDTPLTDILVRARAQVAGATASRVTCVNDAAIPVNIGNSPQPSASTFADPAQVDAIGVRPGTYTCTIIVDP